MRFSTFASALFALSVAAPLALAWSSKQFNQCGHKIICIYTPKSVDIMCTKWGFEVQSVPRDETQENVWMTDTTGNHTAVLCYHKGGNGVIAAYYDKEYKDSTAVVVNEGLQFSWGGERVSAIPARKWTSKQEKLAQGKIYDELFINAH